jgi:hypothetical protein
MRRIEDFILGLRRDRKTLHKLAATVVAISAIRCTADTPSSSKSESIAASQQALLGTDIQVQTGLGSNEPSIAISPLNSQLIAVSQCFGIALSFDGGKNFTTTAIPVPAGYGGGGCDDVLTFDAAGRLFVTFLSSKANALDAKFGGPDVFVQQIDVRPAATAFASRRIDVAGKDCTAVGSSAAQCPINVSTQLGLGACNDVTTGRSADRQWFVADQRPACANPPPARSTRTCSPFSNNLYLIWSDGDCGTGAPSGIRVASSSNQGAAWTSQLLTAGPGDLRQVGMAVAANGDAYAGYHAQSVDATGQPDGLSGQILLYQSTNGTAAGFAAAGATPFPSPLADITRNQQQCSCGAGTCATAKTACSFSAGTCPSGTCECPAGDACTPPVGCPNTPAAGFRPCSRRLSNDAVLTWGSESPSIVTDPTNPNNVAVFASTDPNRAGTAVDNLDVQYSVSTNAASGTPTWSALRNVRPGGSALPVSNQLFPNAINALSNSCVTLAYYDDRNPTTDAQGNHLMDVYVTVHPNLWGAGNWQAEANINHAAFDPDVTPGLNDFFSYCGGAAGCVAPAGWRSTSRIGEYFGILQASGIAWTGNVGAPPTDQQILFNYSDAVAPVVTAPPPLAPTSCGAVALGTATATDVCGLAPLSAVTNNAPATFPCGQTTVTYKATDGAGNVGTATQTVTVNDTTTPTFAAGTPTQVQLVACQSTPQLATIPTPSATSSCGAATVTGKITAINGVTQNPAIALVGGKATVGPGVYKISWTATNCGGVSSAAFVQTFTITSAPALYAHHNLNIGTLASVVTQSGAGAPIANDGTQFLGSTQLALGATAGSVSSVPGVTLAGSTTGSVVSGGLVVNLLATVNGTVTQLTTPTLPQFPPLSVTYPFTLTNVNVLPLTTRVLAPGSYNNVVVPPTGTLVLTAGTYLFNTLSIAPAATLRVDNTSGTVGVNVALNIIELGIISSNGTPDQFVLGYTGVLPVPLVTNFSGIVIAPSASLSLAQPLFGNYAGAFYARDIQVAPGVRVTEYPHFCSIP